MCGIFFYLSGTQIKGRHMKFLEECAYKIKHRGPDDTRIRYYGSNAMACFHRLRITDLTSEGMQPFEVADSFGTWVCMVNGEIYNFKELAEELEDDLDFDYKPSSHSDCEVVLHLFLSYINHSDHQTAVERLMNKLDGEYAVVLYNTDTEQAYAFTDELRVRPLFSGYDLDTGSVCIASEQKAIPAGFKVRALEPGHLFKVCIRGSPSSRGAANPYWLTPMNETISLSEAAQQLRQLLVANTHSKMHPDRPYGFLLSGGLDSSLVCGIAARYCKERGLPRIRTFTVGFSPEAPDVIAADLVAKHIDSMHEEIIVPYEKGIELIPEIIRYNESWDQTTTRASTPMGIAAREIKKRHPEIAVIYSGEVADELFRGYLYNRIPQLPVDIKDDMTMRLQDITYFDGLRADRVISSQGMELRLPFFGKELLKFAYSLPVDFLDPSAHDGTEKWLVRKAFDGQGYIPQEILWRTKNAFSDATSVNTDAGSQWKEMIKREADLHVSDSRFIARGKIYEYQTPQTKEDMWYRDLFDSHEYEEKTIPYKWLPSWIEGVQDSSATTLDVFTETTL